VQDSKHLEDGLVSAGVLGSVMLVEKGEALLRMAPDYLLYYWRREPFEVEERTKQLYNCGGVQDSVRREST